MASFRYYNIIGPALLLLLTSSTECLSAGSSANKSEWVHGYVRDENGSPIADVAINIFDGFTTQTIKTDHNGLYKISEAPVSTDRYAVLFFTKDGYVPKAVNIKVSGARGSEYSMVLNKSDKANTGFVAGVIYQPIRGGKIKFQSGIHGFGKARKVWLERGGIKIEKETGPEGRFLFEVPPGRYKLSGEGAREAAEVDIAGGKTVIRNLRSGLVLVD